MSELPRPSAQRMLVKLNPTIFNRNRHGFTKLVGRLTIPFVQDNLIAAAVERA